MTERRLLWAWLRAYLSGHDQALRNCAAETFDALESAAAEPSVTARPAPAHERPVDPPEAPAAPVAARKTRVITPEGRERMRQAALRVQQRRREQRGAAAAAEKPAVPESPAQATVRAMREDAEQRVRALLAERNGDPITSEEIVTIAQKTRCSAFVVERMARDLLQSPSTPLHRPAGKPRARGISTDRAADTIIAQAQGEAA